MTTTRKEKLTVQATRRSEFLSSLRLSICIVFAVVAAMFVTTRLPEANWPLGVFVAMFFALVFYNGPEALMIATTSFLRAMQNTWKQLFYLPVLWRIIVSLRHLSAFAWGIIALSLWIIATWSAWIAWVFINVRETENFFSLLCAIYIPISFMIMVLVGVIIATAEEFVLGKAGKLLALALCANPPAAFVITILVTFVGATVLASIGAYMAPGIIWWVGSALGDIVHFLLVFVWQIFCFAAKFFRTLVILSHSNRSTICAVDAGVMIAVFYPLLMIVNLFSLPTILDFVLAGIGSGIFGLFNDRCIAPRIQDKVSNPVLIRN